ncbi:hypothetical protein [Caulobacter mirabilis]|uniref:Uncharacterized protein n=1 Tax=Caulobacter mirabilis TaxID=69666 RepID=A0A2D2AXY5_9CAUL|nr:hypothetical protein [Caulobacter mirabilis]ATQ42864.1 hypothetical protein CSW64_10795 [Caulobacter mirabilis]
MYQDDGVTLTERSGRFFIRYDAGGHQVAWREDEITAQDARRAMSGPREAEDVLLALQRRLMAEGLDPYRSNLA